MSFLAKVENTYVGSSGPATSRLLLLENRTLCLDEDLNISKRDKPVLKYPIEHPVQFSESTNESWNQYLAAYIVLEKAKAMFENAKRQFKESEGGKKILSALVPETGPLPVEAVVSDKDVAVLKSMVESHGTTISHVDCTVKGYSIGKITFTLTTPIKMNDASAISHNGYICNLDGMVYNYTDKTLKRIQFINNNGHMYPPFRTEDYKDIQATQ